MLVAKKFLIGLTFVACVSALVEVQNSYNYHKRVGIPEAARIKAAEDTILTNENIKERIVGGEVAKQGSHPYLAGLMIKLENFYVSYCGSTLLNTNRLVTAAHCWFDGLNRGRQLTVVLGSQFLFFGGTRITTSKVVMYPQWNPKTSANDIAMIYLPTSVVFNANIQPVSLPNRTQLSETFVGKRALAAGYGITSDRQMQTSPLISQVFLEVITVRQCQEIYGTQVQSSVLCTNGTGGVGICNGDSGGPLVEIRKKKNILIGISAFGGTELCQSGYPSGFTRVTSFYDFILQHLE